jgi:hypothetical protein
MFKFLFGAFVVIALFGYGVLTTEHLELAGDAVVETINTGAAYVKDATDKTVVEQAQEAVAERLK